MDVSKCNNTKEEIYYCNNANRGKVNCEKKQNIISFQAKPTTVTVIGKAAPTTSKRTSTTGASQASATSQSSPGVSSTSQDTAPTSPPTSESGSSSVTGIAVGASIGGVAFILIVLGAAFWYRRRRAAAPVTQANESQTLHDDGAKKPEENSEARASELYAEPVVRELPPNQCSAARYELPLEPYHDSR
ncbi:hypothetical protein PG990_001943 [Apiospora arundinis]